MPAQVLFDVVDPPAHGYISGATFWVNILTGSIWKPNPAAQRYEAIESSLVPLSLLGTAALLDTPIPMSEISQPVKQIIDTIRVLIDPAAFHEASDFAGAAALSAVAAGKVDKVSGKGLSKNDLTDALSALISSAVQPDPTLTYHRDRVTTSSASPAVVRSLSVAVNSVMFVDCIATFQDNATHLLGGYIWATLSFARAGGLPVPLGSLDILESHNLAGSTITMPVNASTGNVDITVKGKAGISTSWSLRTTADRGNP